MCDGIAAVRFVALLPGVARRPVARCRTALTCASPSWRCSRHGKLPDRERQFGGIETNALVLALPREAVSTHQVQRIECAPVGQTELPQRQLDRGLLRRVRIEADRDQDHLTSARCALAVQQYLVVRRRVERDAEMRLQCGMRAADTIE